MIQSLYLFLNHFTTCIHAYQQLLYLKAIKDGFCRVMCLLLFVYKDPMYTKCFLKKNLKCDSLDHTVNVKQMKASILQPCKFYRGSTKLNVIMYVRPPPNFASIYCFMLICIAAILENLEGWFSWDNIFVYKDLYKKNLEYTYNE